MVKNERWIKRLLMIGHGVVFQLVNAFSTAIVAFLVIKTNHASLWGKFAGIWLLITWLMLLFNFGSKDFLLKSFSLPNANIRVQLQRVFFVRLPILVVCITCTIFIFPLKQTMLIAGILLLSFIINSFQALLIFERQFKFLMLAELSAVASQIAFLLSKKDDLNLVVLLFSFLIYHVVKTLLIFFKCKRSFNVQAIHIDYSLLRSLFPFFLLTLGGMLVNKSDFLMVTALLNDENKALYQVISTFSSMGIIAANTLLQPFVKQMYRVQWELFHVILKKYFVAGIILSLLYTITVCFGIQLFFKYQLSFFAMILLYAVELIFFAINPLVFYLFRKDKQQHFVVIVLIAGFISLLSAWLLVPIYGVEGALLANLLGNMCMFILIWRAKLQLEAH
jgi:O-antigen/teichoic acid export membrane protein